MIGAAFILATLAAPAPASAPTPAPDAPADIVVVAARGRCHIVYAGSKLDGRALQRLANGWPSGRPLRVREPNRADRKCLTKIALELSERGFNNLVFVSPQAPPGS